MNSLQTVAKNLAPTPAREGAKRALRAFAVGTSPLRQLPDFLIIGTKRGGTTSMFNYLLRHPLVTPMFPSAQNLKSAHYFDLHYGNGTAWYRSHFATAAYRARLRRRYGQPPVAGEASPYYLFHPHAPQRVQALLPQVKLIVLLRNPVDRAWSHYWERVSNGVEPLGFEEALHREDERLAGEVERMLADPLYNSPAHDYYSYLARGRYLEQLERWLQCFPREQFCILRSEDFYADPAKVYRQVLDFLELPPIDLGDWRRYSLVPSGVRRSERMSPATRRWLWELYADANRRLEAALGMRFGWDEQD